jgi:hypothetical protein
MTTFRYIPHSQIEAWKAKGWTVADDLSGTNHGFYSVLMFKEGDHDD